MASAVNSKNADRYTATLAFLVDLKTIYPVSGQKMINKIIHYFVNLNPDSNEFCDLEKVINKKQLELDEWETNGNKIKSEKHQLWKQIKKQCLAFSVADDLEISSDSAKGNNKKTRKIAVSAQAFLDQYKHKEPSNEVNWIYKKINPICIRQENISVDKMLTGLLHELGLLIENVGDDRDVYLIYEKRRTAIGEMIKAYDEYVDETGIDVDVITDEKSLESDLSSLFYWVEYEDEQCQMVDGDEQCQMKRRVDVKFGNELVKSLDNVADAELLTAMLNKLIQ